ncbi:MAG: hypothetical protein WCF84_10660 [Anaerolineae bacterium]
MQGRSPFVIAGMVAGGCLLLLACIAFFSISAFYLFSHNTLLDALAPTASNRIVYVGNDSNIYVVEPNGKNRVSLTQDGDGNGPLRYDYPVWAPDGRHLAFVGMKYAGQGIDNATLYSVEPAGNNRRTLYQSDQSFPIYLYWSPDSRYVSFLANKDNTALALRAASLDGQTPIQELDSGSPLYWAWAPDAQSMFLHIGGTLADSDSAHLSLLPFGGKQTAQPLASSPGAFQAPQWSQDGKSVLYAQQDTNNRQTLMIADAQGQHARSLFTYVGRIAFAWSPDGNRIAYIATPPEAGITTLGQVHVIDANGQNDRPVGDTHALAMLWSPNGKRLADLSIDMGGNNTSYRFQGLAQTTNALKLRWEATDMESGQVHPIAALIPTDGFISTLPYFDQYARSTTFWSPDSQQFVYTTVEANGDGSIWVADANGVNAPRKIGDGGIAFWSWR